MKKASYCILSILLPCLFLSCNNRLLNQQNEQEISTEKARISFSVQMNDPNERLIGAQPLKQNDITNVELIIQSTAGEDKYNYASIDELCKSVLELEPKIYNFYLKIYANNIENESRLVFSAKNESVVVSANETMTITFNAKYVTSGDLSIIFRYLVDKTEGNRIGYTKIGLFETPAWDSPVSGYTSSEYEVKEETPDDPEQAQTETYYSATFNAKDIPNGIYYIKVDTYDNDTEEIHEEDRLLNTFSEQIQIYGYKTAGYIWPEKYNRNFYIKYNLNGGTIIDQAAFIRKHNQNTEVALPTNKAIKREGYTFEGWSESEDFSSNFIQGITAANGNLTKDVVLYAKWTDGDNPELTHTDLSSYYTTGNPAITFTANDSNAVSDILLTITKDGETITDYSAHGITIEKDGVDTPTMSATVSFAIDGSNDGRYTITATAKDIVNNLSEAKEVSTIIDATAPTLTSTNLDAVYKKDSTPSVTFTASDTNEISDIRIVIRKDGIQLTESQYSSNGISISTTPKEITSGISSMSTRVSFTADGTQDYNGEYSITVSATDAAGNESDQQTLSTIIDGSMENILNITIDTGTDSDIAVAVTVDGEEVQNNVGISGTQIVFTAETGYLSYTWKIDGVVQTFPTTDNNNILTINTSNYSKGTYDITLVAAKRIGEEPNPEIIYDSFYAQIKISE